MFSHYRHEGHSFQISEASFCTAMDLIVIVSIQFIVFAHVMIVSEMHI